MLSTSGKRALLALFGYSLLIKTAFATPSATESYVAATTGVMKSEGCYSSSADMTDEGTFEWQSSAHCQATCLALSKPVLGLQNGGHCWCGDSLPATDTNVSLSECSVGCFGYSEPCGGKTTWTVWLTGLSAEVPVYGSSDDDSDSSSSTSVAAATSSVTSAAASSTSATDDTDSSSTSSTLSSAAVVPASSTSAAASAASTSDVSSTVVQATIVQIQTVTVGGSVKTVEGTTVVSSTVGVASTGTADDKASSGSSSNKAGIAAGVVVGVIALACLVGGVVYFLKRRSKKAKESTHRRHTSLDAFVSTAGRNQAIAGGVRASTMNDSRLDPRIMVERRQSQGSLFADNVDYSRRILKVANPDE